MAKTQDQSIPSELVRKYKAALIPAYEQRTQDIVKKRIPWKLPRSQGKIDQNGNHIGPDGSPKQLTVRTAFINSCACFGLQPETGGSEPPTIGPRARSWWYNAAIGSGLWYFNYFMKQTIPQYLQGQTPEWCRLGANEITFIDSTLPNGNFVTNTYVNVLAQTNYYWITLIPIPSALLSARSLTIHLYLEKLTNYDWYEGEKTFTLTAWVINESWNPWAVTWATKPLLAEKVAEKNLTYTLPYGFHYTYSPKEYISIKLPPAGAIPFGIALQTPFYALGTTFRFTNWIAASNKPFWTA